MKIAMLIEGWDDVWGGGQKVALEISKVLSSKYGIEIDLYVMNFGGFRRKEKVNENFRVIRVGKKLSWSFKDRLKWLFLVRKQILQNHKNKNYDLIYCHANLPGLVGKILSRELQIPVVYHVHGSGVEAIEQMYGRGLRSWLLYWVEVFLQRKIRYDLEITVDRRFLHYGNVNKPVYVPNGVDIEEFNKIKVEKEKKFFKILFVGRLHPQKGLIYLIKAVYRIKSFLRERNVKVVIVGEGDEKERLVSLMRRLGVENFFIFKGKKQGEDLIREYKSSHLFILPSLYEGLPLTVLEAWASKLPVLVTKVGDLPFVVSESENGWLVKAGVSRLLSRKLKDALSLDSRELRRVGERGYARAVKDYSWETVCSKIYSKVKLISK